MHWLRSDTVHGRFLRQECELDISYKGDSQSMTCGKSVDPAESRPLSTLLYHRAPQTAYQYTGMRVRNYCILPI